MADLRDYTGKNRIFTGGKGVDIPSGATGDRDTSFGGGAIRFNSTTNLMEYYTGTDWKAIDAPPIVTSIQIDGGSAVTSGTVDNEAVGDITILVNGSLFDTTGANVTFVGGNTVQTQSITRNNASLLTVTVTPSDFTIANSPYTVKVTNGSGLSAELAEAISADTAAPTFTNAADTIYTIYDSQRSSVSISASDLCGASGGSNFSVTTGSLPSGLTMSSSDGSISGTLSGSVGSDTTTTFTVTATGDDTTGSRQFKITEKAPQVTTYTSGSGTYSVPSGISTLDVLVIGTGGPGGSRSGGGGGAGGMVDRAGFPVTPGGSVSYSVGGQGPQPGNGTAPTKGSNSTFGTLTALAGGAGQMDSQGQVNGGSGGGRHYDQTPTGTGQQPSQPGDSGTYGHGHPGGTGNQGPHHSPGGGGGAGSAGQNGGTPGANSAGAGGQGRVSTVSGSPVTYAGGGGGGGHPDCTGNGPGGPGGGANGGSGGGSGGQATANRGGGGGGAFQSSSGGRGGSGIVIVKY